MKKLLGILCALVSIGGALFFGIRLLNRFRRTAREDRKERKVQQVYTWEQGDDSEAAEENISTEDETAEQDDR